MSSFLHSASLVVVVPVHEHDGSISIISSHQGVASCVVVSEGSRSKVRADTEIRIPVHGFACQLQVGLAVRCNSQRVFDMGVSCLFLISTTAITEN